MKHKLQLVPLDDLLSDPRNAKKHDLDTMDASITRHGLIDLPVLDSRTGFIVSGHGRTKTLKARRNNGDAPPEGVVVKNGEWLVPTVTGWESANDDEAAAAAISLNRIGELGGWDDTALVARLEELRDVEGGFIGVGFAETELAGLARRLELLSAEVPRPGPGARRETFENEEISLDDIEVELAHTCPSCGFRFN